MPLKDTLGMGVESQLASLHGLQAASLEPLAIFPYGKEKLGLVGEGKLRGRTQSRKVMEKPDGREGEF